MTNVTHEVPKIYWKFLQRYHQPIRRRNTKFDFSCQIGWWQNEDQIWGTEYRKDIQFHWLKAAHVSYCLGYSYTIIDTLLHPSLHEPLRSFCKSKDLERLKNNTKVKKLNQMSQQFVKTPVLTSYEWSFKLNTSISRHNCHSEHTVLVREWVLHNYVVVPISYGDFTILLRLKIHINVIIYNKGIVTVRDKIALESNFL